MQGLYKKVIKGQYPKIPNTFSTDLWRIVTALLQVNPQARPDCNNIINFPYFSKKAQELFDEEPDIEESELLKTIRMPKNLMYLSNRLPNPTYNLKSG